MSGMSFLSTPTVCKRQKCYYTQSISRLIRQTSIMQKQKALLIFIYLFIYYLSQLHKLSNLCHPGQEPLVDLQGLLAVALLHLEIFFCDKKDKIKLPVAPIWALVVKEFHTNGRFVMTNLVGWWFRRCRTQTVWPDLWRGAWTLRWWCRCSAPWDEPEGTDVFLWCDIAMFANVFFT